MIQGNPPLSEETSLWEALSVVSQKWIPFPTAVSLFVGQNEGEAQWRRFSMYKKRGADPRGACGGHRAGGMRRRRWETVL